MVGWGGGRKVKGRRGREERGLQAYGNFHTHQHLLRSLRLGKKSGLLKKKKKKKKERKSQVSSIGRSGLNCVVCLDSCSPLVSLAQAIGGRGKREEGGRDRNRMREKEKKERGRFLKCV